MRAIWATSAADSARALTCERRHLENGRVGRERQFGSCDLGELTGGRIALLNEIPLVEGDHKALALFVREARDARVLSHEPPRRVCDQNHHVRVLYAAECPHRAVELDPALYARFLPQPGRVDQHESLILVVDDRVDRVSRRAGLRVDQHDVLADDAVDQRRLADVRTADHGHADAGLLRGRGRLGYGRH